MLPCHHFALYNKNSFTDFFFFVCVFELLQLLALLSGSAGGETASLSEEAFPAGTASSPVASPSSSAGSYAFSHKQDASSSSHSHDAAAAAATRGEGEGGPTGTTPAASSSSSSSISIRSHSHSHSHGMATSTSSVDIREGIKALVRQHKKDIEALGRLRASKYQSNLPAANAANEAGLDIKEEEEDEATTTDLLAKNISNVSSTVADARKGANGRTQHSSTSDNDDHGDNNKNNSDNENENENRVERWLDWNEEVPTSTINAAHPAVAAASAGAAGAGAGAAGKQDGSARKPRASAGSSSSSSSTCCGGPSSGTTHVGAGAGGEHLPPIPPLSSPSTISEDGRGEMPSSHLIQSSSKSKSQAASLATDYEDTSSAPRPAGAGATSAVKKSLRLPRGPVNAPSSAIAVAVAATADAAMAAARAEDPRCGLTVFRSINSELERQRLQQHAANGARLVKKIGAVLAAERDPTHNQRSVGVGAGGAAGSNNNNNLHAHHHHHRRPHHHHRHQEHNHQLLLQSGEPAEHISPSSARRALKARNVLDSMTTSSFTSFSTANPTSGSTGRTNTLGGSPSGATATPTTRDDSYSDVMRI